VVQHMPEGCLRKCFLRRLMCCEIRRQRGQAAKTLRKPFGICCTTTMLPGKSPGQLRQKILERVGPPVEMPMATSLVGLPARCVKPVCWAWPVSEQAAGGVAHLAAGGDFDLLIKSSAIASCARTRSVMRLGHKIKWPIARA